MGAEIARPKPFADCSREIASPRCVTNSRDTSGTNTTRPMQFAPSVITTPYSSTTCHSVVACEDPSSPAVSRQPPSSTMRRAPSRSTSDPTKGDDTPPMICPTE